MQITNCPDDVNNDYSPDHVIIGDAELVLDDLITELKDKELVLVPELNYQGQFSSFLRSHISGPES